LKCLKKSITQVDVIFIVYSYTQGTSPEDIAAVKVLKLFLEELSVNMALIITHAELISSEKEKGVIEEMSKSDTKELLELCQNRVYFTGILDEDQKDWFGNDEIVEINRVSCFRHKHLISQIINENVFKAPGSLPSDIVNLHSQALINLRERYKNTARANPVEEKINYPNTQPKPHVPVSSPRTGQGNTIQIRNTTPQTKNNQGGGCVIS